MIDGRIIDSRLSIEFAIALSILSERDKSSIKRIISSCHIRRSEYSTHCVFRFVRSAIERLLAFDSRYVDQLDQMNYDQTGYEVNLLQTTLSRAYRREYEFLLCILAPLVASREIRARISPLATALTKQVADICTTVPSFAIRTREWVPG